MIEKIDFDQVMDDRFSPEIHKKLKEGKVGIAALEALALILERCLPEAAWDIFIWWILILWI